MIDRFFAFFERFARPFDREEPGHPPANGLAFILYFARQTPVPFFAMLVLGGITALIEMTMFSFVGIIVDRMAAGEPASFFSDNANLLIGMLLLVGIGRALTWVATAIVEEQIVVPEFFSMVRWQSHRAVSRQDVSFFDDEMAGRIYSKVWQSGASAGDFLVSLLQIIWFIIIYAISTLLVVASLDWRLMLPVLLWLCLVSLFARTFVPRIRDGARETAEAVSGLSGRMVDGYTNIRTLKLHAAMNDNDRVVRQAYDTVLDRLFVYTRAISMMRISHQLTSTFMLIVIAAVAFWLFSIGDITAGAVTIALTLSLRLNLLLGRLLGLLNGLFRNFGTVQNSAALISQQASILDAPDADTLGASEGRITFDRVSFRYTRAQGVLSDFSLTIPAGQKVGIVGPSGVGKTTLINLLLRFHDLNSGTITIDGTDIASVTQDSLRALFGMVSQDTALLNRSVRDNILHGRPDAGPEELEAAARKAHAHDFILELSDAKGRNGYDAVVGERGVKLSGGQRQRIALARVFLRDAPILLLDEATSALDSEAEAVIQDHLADLMRDKTVIAIAHRLSTIAHLERLIVLQDGAIVEDGTHDELLAANGFYAHLWHRQSGGFLPSEQDQ